MPCRCAPGTAPRTAACQLKPWDIFAPGAGAWAANTAERAEREDQGDDESLNARRYRALRLSIALVEQMTFRISMS